MGGFETPQTSPNCSKRDSKIAAMVTLCFQVQTAVVSTMHQSNDDAVRHVMKSKTLYEVLSIEKDASVEVIKRRYKKLALQVQ